MSISGPFEGRGRQKTAGYVEGSKPRFVRNKKGVRSMIIVDKNFHLCWGQCSMLGQIVSGNEIKNLFLTKLLFIYYFIALHLIALHFITDRPWQTQDRSVHGQSNLLKSLKTDFRIGYCAISLSNKVHGNNKPL